MGCRVVFAVVVEDDGAFREELGGQGSLGAGGEMGRWLEGVMRDGAGDGVGDGDGVGEERMEGISPRVRRRTVTILHGSGAW